MLPDLTPKTLAVKALGWYLEQSVSVTSTPDIDVDSGPNNIGAFGSYMQLALLDPKAPLELKALGPTLWVAANVIPVTFLMWHIDPQ